jgi:hypothetical protein
MMSGYRPVTMLWPDEKRARYAGVRQRMTPEEGKRMRCIRGARAAHRAIRAQGRTPGDEGRAKIAANRDAQTRDIEEGKKWRRGQANVEGI